MTSATTKPTTTFWILSIAALLWNITGALAYISQVTMTPEVIQALPPAEQAMYTNVPSWATSAFALAVWGGVLGCVLLLLRKKLAGPVFIASFAAILVNMYYSFFMSNMLEVSGVVGLVMPITVIIIGACLIPFTRNAAAKGWLS